MYIRALALALTLAALTTDAFAQGSSEQRCILAAAEKLPKLPGLAVTASRAKAMPEKLQKQWQLQHDRYKGFVGAQGPTQRDLPINTFIVEIEARAAAQDTIFSFVCFYATGLPSVVYAMNDGK